MNTTISVTRETARSGMYVRVNWRDHRADTVGVIVAWDLQVISLRSGGGRLVEDRSCAVDRVSLVALS